MKWSGGEKGGEREDSPPFLESSVQYERARGARERRAKWCVGTTQASGARREDYLASSRGGKRLGTNPLLLPLQRLATSSPALTTPRSPSSTGTTKSHLLLPFRWNSAR
jgi:hypothetical protein